ncbi:MAG: FtsQ-type POTRA domain-containing protein [Dehalococcoidia bacterium]|nr:FtsQ-type POTRA domain-containing protein [Dehalococcoidia bacterium]
MARAIPRKSPLRRAARASRPSRLRMQSPTFSRLPFPGQGAVLLALVVAVFVGLAVLVYNSSFLQVRSFEVAGVRVLNQGALIELSQAYGENMLTLRTGEVEDRLEANAYVAEATVSRDWPGVLHIQIVERAPIGTWQVGGSAFLVDAEGVVLDVQVGTPPAGTIPIAAVDGTVPQIGERVDADAINLIDRLRSDIPALSGENVASFEYSRLFGLTVITASGIRVVFEDSKDYDYKLATLVSTLTQARAQGLAFSVIDLRFGDSPALR